MHISIAKTWCRAGMPSRSVSLFSHSGMGNLFNVCFFFFSKVLFMFIVPAAYYCFVLCVCKLFALEMSSFDFLIIFLIISLVTELLNSWCIHYIIKCNYKIAVASFVDLEIYRIVFETFELSSIN